MTVKSAEMAADTAHLSASAQPCQVASRARLGDVHHEQPQDVLVASDHCSGTLLNSALTTKFRVLCHKSDVACCARPMTPNPP
jgi:hypothetical protein